MTIRMFRPTWAALAVLTLASQVHAQTATGSTEKLETVTVTGSLIKRTDKETPSVVQVISRKDIQNSGYANVEELLRSGGSVDAGSISDGAASGFVGGLATISQRGFGSQATLVLINGRRIAPVGAVDINFGRGSLISVNTIPRGAIDRIEILKDGASALYGSDAMAGVINYILRKDFQGIEANGGYSASDTGVGQTKSGGFSFGFGDISAKGFNVFGGVEMSKRDPANGGELKDRGNLDLANFQLNQGGTLTRFTPNSVASRFGSYYRVPASIAGSTVLDGRTVANNSVFGANYLGTYAGCPDSNRVGAGVPTRPDGTAATGASLRAGQCRFDVDTTDEVISAQDRLSGMARATFAISPNITAYADLMVSRTKTIETGLPYVLTTGLVSSANPVAVTWARADGSISRQNALILPVNHPDNPTLGTATAQPVQLVYRFHDLSPQDVTELTSKRLTLGMEGSIGEWDFDTALLYSDQDNKRTLRDRVRKSLLDAALLSGSYRFNGTPNTPEAIRSIASDAETTGDSNITSVDMRASRNLFEMSGGSAAVALGVEYRREKLAATPDANYTSGDYVGLVGNSASGSRNLWAAFSEFRLPVLKSLEVQAAARYEKYSDFGTSTTGKLGAKWQVLPSTLALRGTVATGFRAPSIAQISKAFLLSFNNFQERAVLDPIRCNNTNPAAPVSRSDPPNLRDCNVLGRTATNAAGSIPTAISANPDLKPEKSKSATAGLIFSPTKNIDLAIDGWYFERNDEIRVQRSIDIMDRYVANPTGPDAGSIVRDPNPATWLPGVANSGPIITILRGYGNFKWSKTSGVDYDLNVRYPIEEVGTLKLNIAGSYTARFDQKVLDSSPIDRWAGTSSSGIPTSKASARVTFERSNWSLWTRFNHEDKLTRIGFTDDCLNSPTATVATQTLRANNGCFIGALRTYDAGFSWQPIKGMTVAGSMLNLTNDYGRASNIPYVFSSWDSGNPAQLGRRFSLSLSYATD